MTITRTMDGNAMTVFLEGRMNTESVQRLEKDLDAALETVDRLTVDLKNLTYISSTGLRVLLSAQRTMVSKGGMVIRNVPPQVMEALTLVGFVNLLNIE